MGRQADDGENGGLCSVANAAVKTSPLVVAVIPTWNDTTLTGRCVQSVLNNDYQPLKITVVDDGSTNPCGEELKEQFPIIDTVVSSVNQGFAGAANRGIERALEMNADYILILNNDTEMERSVVGLLVAALQEHPQAGAASALIVYPGSEKRVQFYRKKILRHCAQLEHMETGLLYADRSWSTVSTEFAPACAILFRSAVLREVGLFDECFGTTWEDYDLCIRFIDAGWPLITVGSAVVVHEHGATTGRISPYVTYYFIRNRLICLARHGSLLGILRCAPLFLRSLWWQVREYGFDNWPCHRAFAAGVRDFLLGVRGKGHPPSARRDRAR